MKERVAFGEIARCNLVQKTYYLHIIAIGRASKISRFDWFIHELNRILASQDLDSPGSASQSVSRFHIILERQPRLFSCAFES